MEDIFSVDLNVLKLNQLTVSEYFLLKIMFDSNSSPETSDLEICSDAKIQDLELKGFIKNLPTGPILREKGRELFYKEVDNFFRFINAFPIKTPEGRYLSPKSLEGVAINTLRKKWEKLFKKNSHLEDKVIRILEAEVEWRKKEGKLKFMTAVEAWLNGAYYEKYEYLLENKQQDIQANYNEFM